MVLSYGMGADSTSLLLRWLTEPSSRDFAIDDLVVVSSMTGGVRLDPRGGRDPCAAETGRAWGAFHSDRAVAASDHPRRWGRDRA